MTREIPGWDRFELTDGGITHFVYKKGTGPGVVITHELPGMTPQCIALGNRILAAGFTVYLPLLFGTPNEFHLLRNVARLCISREFVIFRDGRTSPIVVWLRVLCRKVWADCGGPGVGMIGMCLTGNFAIALVAERAVLAPVTCQPSLPVGFSNEAGCLAMCASDLRFAKDRAKRDAVPLLGFRFQGDRLCPPDKFRRLGEEFGELFRPNELPGADHSVLTQDFVDEDGHPTRLALETTLAFLSDRLRH